MLALAAAAAAGEAGIWCDSWFCQTWPEYQGVNFSHIVFMAVPFFVSLVVLYTLAIKPLMKVIEEREHRTEGARAEAAELEAKFNERLVAYEARLAETRQKAADERSAVRKQASVEEERVLSSARNDASKVVEDVRVAVESERVRVRADLRRQAETLAQELAEKALGREFGTAKTAARAGRPGATS